MSTLHATPPPIGVLAGVDDEERLTVLRETGLSGVGVADDPLDRITRVAAALLQAPVAYVTLVGDEDWTAPGAYDQDRQHSPVRHMPVSDSLCQFQVVTGEDLIVPDTTRDPLTQSKPSVQDGSVAAYAGVPLRTAGGLVLGSLCVNDGQPRRWTPEQVDLLHDLAAVVSRDIEHRLTVRRTQQLQAAGGRLAEALPPLLDAVSSLVDLAEQQDEPRLQRYAALTRSRQQRIPSLTRELTAGQPDSPVAVRPSVVDLGRTVERAFRDARAATGSTAVELAPLPDQPLLVRCDPVRLERALVHLLVSALHHTTDGQPLRGQLGVDPADGPRPGKVRLTLTSRGASIPAAELGRVVARFSSASCDAGAATEAAFRIVGGEVRTRSGTISARSSRQGLSFQVDWDLLADIGTVIDLR